ncbi:MAG: alanine dehydrogenase [Chitinophagaceae bacterium]|nr:alanine dehydrogenase [Chitinophagaceae bacterium]
MITIGLIREGKIPPDNRVALTPEQCKWVKNNLPVQIVVQSSPIRCFSDREYRIAGIEVLDNISQSDILFGIKEVPKEALIPDKTYLFFSHTKKKQLWNRDLFKEIIQRNITLVDYECLTHEDGQRILGFGFFAGIVGAHNGIMAYGNRSGAYSLQRVYKQRSFRELIHSYFGLKLPSVKIAITGSGRVAHGILEIMNLLGIIEVEPDEYLVKEFSYPVFAHFKGGMLYGHKETGKYNREDFHDNAQNYRCKFHPYTKVTDILMNGIYWDSSVPRLFEWEHMLEHDFRINTIADITDDINGSIPCNLGDVTMENPVYGVDKISRMVTPPYIKDSIDIMAVGNLPNELPRDASRYFGEQLIKYVLDDLVTKGSSIIERATMIKNGKLTEEYGYLKTYAGIDET